MTTPASAAPAARKPWYRIENATKSDRKDGKRGKAAVYIFDEINPLWGLAAQEIVAEINALDADEIDVHLNSPGGVVWDGIAIMNALRAHPARVTSIVDGLAASIASVIAMAGEDIVMSLGSQMMIHDPSGFAMGDSEVMRELADVLEKQGNNIASIYASRAGGTAQEWRAAMRAETWYTAQEAVDAGLADRVDESAKADDVTNRFDLSIFNHAGRAAAPTPWMPQPKPPAAAPSQPVEPVSNKPTPAQAAARIHNAPVRAAEPNQKGSPVVEFSTEQLADLRAKLGLAEDAPLGPEQVLAALGSSQNGNTPPPTDPPTAAGQTPPTTAQPTQPAQPAQPGEPGQPTGQRPVPGTMVIDASAWQEREERIKRLEAAGVKRAREERDQVIAQAVKDGKFEPARKDHWARLWDADPEGTRQVLDSLAKNVIPVEALGHSDNLDSEQFDEFRHVFPPDTLTSAKGA